MNFTSLNSLLMYDITPDIMLLIIVLLSASLIIMYVYYYRKFLQQNVMYKENFLKVKEVEKSQQALLSYMTDDIYQLTKNLVPKDELSEKSIENEILHSTNNLRELLKIQSNKIEIYNEIFNFNHLLGDISMYLASNFTDRKTELIFDIDENVPEYLSGDVSHLSRIINNILEFAIQATPEGLVRLDISLKETIEKQVILSVQIVDTSIGLTEQSLNGLFDLVYDEKRNMHGGVRLYVAKSLTHAIGGQVTVESKIGVGNTFNLEIPMSLTKKPHTKWYQNLKKQNRQKNVLIYSHQPATSTSLKNMFSYFYDEVNVTSMQELSKQVVSLLDYDLLVMDSTFFSRRNNDYLRRIKKRNDTEIICFSSIFQKENVDSSSPIDQYINVPLDTGSMIKLIENMHEAEKKEEYKKDFSQMLESHLSSTKSPKDVKLPIYRDAVVDSKNIDLESFVDFKGAKLLIVEDNLINQKIILSVLNKSGMDITIANNGQEALDLLFIEKKIFDMVLMDISMPVMDGEAATINIRKEEALNHLPIIVFTAFVMGTEIEEMFEAGANGYLTKPLNIKKLYTMFTLFLKDINRPITLKKEIALDGLDIEYGILMADENEALYKETLKEFSLVYHDMITLVPKWLEEERYDRVRASCGNIQMILQSIGANEMKLLVDEMQKNFLYGNEKFLKKFITLYPEKMTHLMKTIRTYLDN